MSLCILIFFLFHAFYSPIFCTNEYEELPPFIYTNSMASLYTSSVISSLSLIDDYYISDLESFVWEKITTRIHLIFY